MSRIVQFKEFGAADWMDGVDESKIRWADVLKGDEVLADPMPPISTVVKQFDARRGCRH